MNFYEKTLQFITKSFTKDGKVGGTVKHLVRTADWVKELKPDADEALLVAAVSHDIERAFRSADLKEMLQRFPDGFMNPQFLAEHQRIGAEIMTKFLSEQGANLEFANRVAHLIQKHEVGGDEDQNILKDADSISFFENNVDHFVKNKVMDTGADKVKAKFDWMFERITAPKAKDLCRAWYEAAIQQLT